MRHLRGLSLLDVAGKIFAKVLNSRFNQLVGKKILPEAQSGIRAEEERKIWIAYAEKYSRKDVSNKSQSIGMLSTIRMSSIQSASICCLLWWRDLDIPLCFWLSYGQSPLVTLQRSELLVICWRTLECQWVWNKLVWLFLYSSIIFRLLSPFSLLMNQMKHSIR